MKKIASITETAYTSDGRHITTYEYKYDSLGRNTEIVHFGEARDEEHLHRERFEYDPVHGHIKSKTTLYGETVDHIQEYIWDPVNRIEEEVERALGSDGYERHFRRLFDERGHVIRSEGFWEDGGRYSFRICKYTGNGDEYREYEQLWHRPLKCRGEIFGSYSTSSYITDYNERGLESRRCSDNYDWVRYEYGYNDEGDWTRKVGYDDDNLNLIIERSINYMP